MPLHDLEQHRSHLPALSWVSLVFLELRRATRRLTLHPAFSLPAICTLALGIGAAVAAFVVVDSVVLKPLPYDHADRLVRVQTQVPGIDPQARWGLAKGEFLYFQQRAVSLDSMALYRFSRVTLSAEGNDSARSVDVAEVSSDLFSTLGFRLVLGRLPTPEDNLEETPRVVWLSHDLWRERFGGRRDVVGTPIPIDGRSVEVAGVLEPDARLPEEWTTSEIEVGLWMPLWLDPAQPPVPQHVYRTLGRLAEGTSRQEASRELDHLTASLPGALPEAYSDAYLKKTGLATELVPLHEDVVGEDVTRSLWMLFGSVLLVLFIACANVTSLFLARAESSTQETAIRTALGAGRRRLVAGFLAESFLVAAVAGGIGFLLAMGALRVLHLEAPSGLPRLDAIAMDTPAVALTVVLILLTSLFFGLLPTLRHHGIRELRASSSLRTVSFRGRIVRRALVVGQIALSLLLLVGGTLLFRSFRALQDVDPGFETDGVLTLSVVLPDGRYDSYARVGTAYRSLATRLEEATSIEHAAVAMVLPMTGFDGCSSIFVDDRSLPAGEQPPCVPLFLVSPGYFESMGIDVRGRQPDWAEAEQRLPLAVVSRALAQRLWPGVDPIDREVSLSPDLDPFRVVGVAGDVHADGLDKPATEALYLPMTPPPGPQLWPPLKIVQVIVRTESDHPANLIPTVRRLLAEVDPQIPVREARPLSRVVARSMSRLSFFALLMATASGIAFVLSAVGIYGIVSYLVERQRTELGVRMALGARRGEVQRMVLRESVLLAVSGVMLGIAGAVPFTRVLQSLLYGVKATDPWTFGLVGLFLILTAVAASWTPALRASRLPLASVLRQE